MPDFLSTPIKDLTIAIIESEIERSDQAQRDYASRLRAIKRGLEAHAGILAAKSAAETEEGDDG